ncbi:MAG: CDP-glycerol glycerophosphotransferase family protein [Candidatus Sungiibacteriota bacterium]|uniref:CDP-glycerol glycerophosphotransferase family protein n=1 Tax=Candidatus Sungiibacteriota bacterium TaxID=2750080 RepID=A0A7T5USA3_9BACT|nr:MAG: CDP-glycerol glycerophosphotransferase family protein [Candidatus Sungbacteria bacterium]
MTKTIFITVGEASVAHHLLRGEFWRKLLAGRNFRIVLIVPPSKAEEYRKEFSGDNILVEALPSIPFSTLERLMLFLALNALRTSTVTLNQMRKYLTTQGLMRHIAFFLKRGLWFFLGRSRIFQKFLRTAETFLPPHPSVGQLFERYHPSLVFSTVAMFAQMDVPILREARRRMVQTIGITRGWDNFTNSGVMRVVPDILLVHSRFAGKTAQKYQFIPDQRTIRVGFPRNDWFLRKDLIDSRQDFLARLGIDPKKRVIFFGAMEYFWFPRDGEIARIFNNLVESGKLPQDLIMLFRPYPGSTGSMERIEGLRYVVPDISSFTKSAADVWEMREKETAHLMNSIFHSEMVVTVASTLGIDGIVLDKPAISVGFEAGPAPYWFSAGRFLDHWSHWQALLETGGFRRADTAEEFANAIRSYLKNPHLDFEGRERVREQFLEPYDGRVGERIARILLKKLYS